MRVTVRCYGPARELAGEETLALALAAPATVADALAVLAGRGERVAALLRQCAVAVGDDIVPRCHALVDGDEVALLPPVAGG